MKYLFSSGLVVIPIITLIGALYSWYRFYRAWSSGTRIDMGMNSNPRYTWTDEKMPITSIGAFWFGVILTLATIAIIWGIVSEK